MRQTDRRTNILILLLYRLGLRPSVGPLRGSRQYRWNSLNQFLMHTVKFHVSNLLFTPSILTNTAKKDFHHFLG